MERHDTPVTFSRAEAQKIRQALAAADRELRCPPCGSELVIRGPVGGGGSNRSVWEIRCPSCSHSMYVRDLPESRRPRGGS